MKALTKRIMALASVLVLGLTGLDRTAMAGSLGTTSAAVDEHVVAEAGHGELG